MIALQKREKQIPYIAAMQNYSASIQLVLQKLPQTSESPTIIYRFFAYCI